MYKKGANVSVSELSRYDEENSRIVSQYDDKSFELNFNSQTISRMTKGGKTSGLTIQQEEFRKRLAQRKNKPSLNKPKLKNLELD